MDDNQTPTLEEKKILVIKFLKQTLRALLIQAGINTLIVVSIFSFFAAFLDTAILNWGRFLTFLVIAVVLMLDSFINNVIAAFAVFNIVRKIE